MHERGILIQFIARGPQVVDQAATYRRPGLGIVECLPQACEYLLLPGLMAVKLEAHAPQSDLVEIRTHNIERGHLLGYEQDLLSPAHACGNDVRDRLGLASARGALNDEMPVILYFMNDN